MGDEELEKLRIWNLGFGRPDPLTTDRTFLAPRWRRCGPGADGASRKLVEKRIDGRPIALHFDPHLAGLVADPAGQLLATGRIVDERPKSHPLHDAAHCDRHATPGRHTSVRPDFFHCFVHSHTICKLVGRVARFPSVQSDTPSQWTQSRVARRGQSRKTATRAITTKIAGRHA